MPVARLRGEDGRVDHIVVRETVQDDGTGANSLGAAFEPARTIRRLDGFLGEPAQLQPRDSDDYDDKDDGSRREDSPSPLLVTMTVTLPQIKATGGAFVQKSPTETVVVSIPPPPPKHENHKGGISQTTEHLLIAAGSIGATIVVVMILLAIHTMRKRGLTFAEAVKQGKYQVTRRGPRPPPKSNGTIRDKTAYSTDYSSVRNDTITAPEPAMARNGSFSSQRPLLTPQRNESLNRGVIPGQAVSSDTEPRSFLLDSSPRRNNSHRRDVSETPSSPVLPLQNQRASESTRNTRSMSGGSELRYPEPPIERSLSPLPPPPTFRQFLFNRPSISQRPGLVPMVSRFSWTNSQAPQTPHDPNRDTNSHTVMRDSYLTSRSSVPRFRTVDSWVNQQANRIEEQKLKEQFRLTQTSTIYFGDDDAVPDVPMIPKNVNDLKEGTTPIVEVSTPSSPPPPPVGGLPGKNIRHERHDTHTTVETAPIFRQHPGNEVRFSTRSLVPSEILDRKMPLNVMS